ncbi:MAG: hypothetical protein OEV00_13310 [Acidobacteriota bacterium]|nr:hypothetical protein [Acidobacteriota bacterium]MDH3786289.1 hypothetical protein [Acidobacteriota bacterium]
MSPTYDNPHGETPPQPQAPPAQTYAAPPAAAAPTVVADPRRRLIALACFLSIMPGLGQIYVGYYKVGFIHILTVASTIALLANDVARPLTPLLALFLAFFWLYNIVDAGRRAFAYNFALSNNTEEAAITMPEGFGFPPGGTILAGLIITGLGLAFLAENVWDISMLWVEDWWPVAPIAFGLYLLSRGWKEHQSAE